MRYLKQAPGDVVRPKSQNKRGRPRKLPYVGQNGDEQNDQTGYFPFNLEYKSFSCRYVLNN